MNIQGNLDILSQLRGGAHVSNSGNFPNFNFEACRFFQFCEFDALTFIFGRIRENRTTSKKSLPESIKNSWS